MKCTSSDCRADALYQALSPLNCKGAYWCEDHARDSATFWQSMGFEPPTFRILATGQTGQFKLPQDALEQLQRETEAGLA